MSEIEFHTTENEIHKSEVYLEKVAFPGLFQSYEFHFQRCENAYQK